MLLVDHDQADVGQRRKDRGARPDAHTCRARAQAQPLGAALGVAEPRMQDGDHVSESPPEAPDGLRRERDLGDHYDRAATSRKSSMNRLQVDLGFARAGHSVKQEGPVLFGAAALADSEQNLFQCSALIGVQARCLRLFFRGVRAIWPPADRTRHELHEAAILEPPQSRGAKLGRNGRAICKQPLEHRALPGREASARDERPMPSLGQLCDQHLARARRSSRAWRQHQAQRPGQRRAILRCHPAGQPHQIDG